MTIKGVTSHNLQLKEVTQNFTLWELSEMMYNEHTSVFKDTTLYERLDSDNEKLIYDEDLFCNASKWYTDLTKEKT